MLLSMTGFGEARRSEDGVNVTVEVRTVNSRYLKVSSRCSEGYASLESQIEGVVRRQVNRGTTQVSLHVRRDEQREDYRLNETVLAAYWKQLEDLADRWHLGSSPSLGSVIQLPGIVEHKAATVEASADWPLVESVLDEALANLAAMRRREGESMASDLLANVTQIESELKQIEERAPRVVEAYHQRLTDRLNKLLAEHDVEVEPAQVIREVGLFAERSDISEEIVRLRSHTAQFRETVDSQQSAGRKLEFVTQEMFRETNTIGSKANDSEISKHVIEIKGAIERIREMIQNVE